MTPEEVIEEIAGGKMRMKKRIIAIMIVTTMSFCLMACGADSDKEVATEEVVTEIESEQQEIEEPTESVQEIESTEATEEVEESTVDLEETEVAEVAEEKTIQPVSYDDFNINGFGYSNYIDLYGAGNGYDDVERVSIMATNCSAYDDYPDQMTTDTMTYRGIKLGDSREMVIAAYGEPYKEVVYQSKNYNHDDLQSQYNLCYSYIDDRYPEVFFNLSFSMDQNDNVLNICYEAILMKWY